MDVKHIYNDDLKIAKALLRKDLTVTRDFFYKKCYPLFKSIYDNYHTDCTCCKEFIDEIYILILSPSKTTGKCQLENYIGESTLPSWIKSVCLFYCYKKFDIKKKMPKSEPIYTPFGEDSSSKGDRNDDIYGSISIDLKDMKKAETLKIFNMMPNKRYARLLELRYVMDMTNEETADALGINIDSYYNVHKRAKAQFKRICRKEELYDK